MTLDHNLFTTDSIAAAIDTAYSPDTTTPGISTVENILVEFEDNVLEHDWDPLIDSVNNGHCRILHLSQNAVIIETSYEAFSAPLNRIGYDESALVRTILRIHKEAAAEHAPRDHSVDTYPLVLTLPETVE